MEPIRVLLANHHPIVRNGLRLLLERDSRIRVVGEAATGQEAVTLAEYQHPGVAILDTKLPLVRGIAAARVISSTEPKTQVVILGGLKDESYVHKAFDAGARGYVLGDSAQTDLLPAVFAVMAGGVFLSPLVSRNLLDDWNRSRSEGETALTEREKRWFSLLAEGRHEADIARILMIPEEEAQSACEEIRHSLQRLGISKALLWSMAG